MKNVIALLTFIFTCTISLVSMKELSEETKAYWIHKVSQNVRQCPCGINFTNYDEVVDHAKKAHSQFNKPTKYVCPKCSIRSNNLDSFIVHFTFHTQEIIYRCHQCDFETHHSTNIQNHLILHQKYSAEYNYLAQYKCCLKNGEGKFECPNCQGTFRGLGHLLKHVNSKHLQPKTRELRKILLSPIEPNTSLAPQNHSIPSEQMVTELIRQSQALLPSQSCVQANNNDEEAPDIIQPLHTYRPHKSTSYIENDLEEQCTLPPLLDSCPQEEEDALQMILEPSHDYCPHVQTNEEEDLSQYTLAPFEEGTEPAEETSWPLNIKRIIKTQNSILKKRKHYSGKKAGK